MPHCWPSHCVPVVVVPVPVPLAASSPLPMHQPYSLRAVAHSGGVWCCGLVVLVVVLAAGLRLSSPSSPSSEDAPVMHPTSSCSWTCGGCWFVVPWGRWWGVISMRWQVGCIPALYGPPSAVCSPLHPSHFLLCSSPRAWGDSSSFFPEKSINLMVSMIE